MKIEDLEKNVHSNLFTSNFTNYENSIQLIFDCYERGSGNNNIEIIDLLFEVLDNKNVTYVQGFFSNEIKNKILDFIRHHWFVTLANERENNIEKLREDSLVSNLLGILILIAPVEGKVNELLHDFQIVEENIIYKKWISNYIDNIRSEEIM